MKESPPETLHTKYEHIISIRDGITSIRDEKLPESFWNRFNLETQKIDSEIKRSIAPLKRNWKTETNRNRNLVGGYKCDAYIYKIDSLTLVWHNFPANTGAFRPGVRPQPVAIAEIVFAGSLRGQQDWFRVSLCLFSAVQIHFLCPQSNDHSTLMMNTQYMCLSISLSLSLWSL